MRHLLHWAGLPLLSAAIFCGSVRAAEFSYGPTNPDKPLGTQALIVRGEIQNGDINKLRLVIKADPTRFEHSAIVLASEGGDILEAIRLGEFIRSSYQTVFVSAKVGTCASACFLIYISAVERSAQSPALGIHRPYFSKNYFAGLSVAQAEAKQRMIFERIREFLQAQEVPQDLQERMFSLASSEIYWLTPADMYRVGLRSNWYDQLLVSRCNLDKQLEQDYLEQGLHADEARTNFRQVAACAYDLTFVERRNTIQKFVASAR